VKLVGRRGVVEVYVPEEGMEKVSGKPELVWVLVVDGMVKQCGCRGFMWINGADNNQHEQVFPPITSMPFGITSTGYAPFVTGRLRLVR
jgi:hypothetical protein